RLEPSRDALFDRVVVADLEVQERHVDVRAPVTSVETPRLRDVERAAEHAIALPREHDFDRGTSWVREIVALHRESLARESEEFFVQVAAAPDELVHRREVELVRERDRRLVDRGTAARLDDDAALAEQSSLASELVPALAVEGGEKIGVCVKSLVFPVELHAVAERPIALGEHARLVLARKEDVRGRRAELLCDEGERVGDE